MLTWCKLKLERQLLLAVLCAAAAGALAYFFGFEPRLRMTVEMLMRGIFGGIATAAAVLLLQCVFLLWRRGNYHQTLLELSERTSGRSAFVLIGAALTAGIAEEFLLRGFVFALASKETLWMGLLINFAATFLGYYEWRRNILWPTGRALEATVYALMYYEHRSLFMVACAHGVVEVVLWAALRYKPLQHAYSAYGSGPALFKGLLKLVRQRSPNKAGA